MTATRRQVLRMAAGLAGGVPLAAGCDRATGRCTRTVGRVHFIRPLAIPPLDTGRPDGAGGRVFDLTARAGQRRFRDGPATRTYGINGGYLGPTLRARRGDRVSVHVRNALPETTTLHWHGMHLPATCDGGPHQPIAPGATWSPEWQVRQAASTLWYHPHPHGRTEKHVYRGLAGMFILDDEQSTGLALPHRYGLDDIPVIVQDKRFTPDGQLDESDHRVTGLLGDTVMVNGTVAPYLDVHTQRVRLRLLNASTARIYNLGLSNGRHVALVGTDGGLLPGPVHTPRVHLAPGERAEIVVAMLPGERLVLRSDPQDLGTSPGVTRAAGGDDALDVLQLRAAAALAPSPPPPDRLVDLPALAAAGTAVDRTFRLAGRRINGRKMDMDRIDEVVARDSVEVWEVRNAHNQPHSFYVHDVQFQVLSVAGAPPPPHLTGRKDTVYLPPEVPVRLALRFADYADPHAPYMYHCHLLFHEDAGMMGQFVVVDGGGSAGARTVPSGPLLTVPGEPHQH